MGNPKKLTRAQEHQKSKRRLLPRNSLQTEHEPQYTPLDVSNASRTALTSVACNNCRARKSKCDGCKPTCSACANRRQQCTYRVEVSPEKMLELRKGSKDLLQALELLRTAPEDSVAVMLQDLRSKGSVSEFLQSVNFGMVATSSMANPLATSLAGTLADSTIELDLNMRYTGAFPSLETLQITDVDLSLLAVHSRPGLTNQHTTMPLSPYSPLDLSSRSTGTPSTSESWSTFSDSTGDAGQRVDPRLEFLKIWQWTSVPIADLLAAQAISFYLVNEHPVLAFFDADLIMRDLESGGRRFCSPLFVSSLLAWSCASYSQFEPRVLSLSHAFLKEAKVRWNELQDHNSVTTLSSAMLLVLTCNQHGQDRVGLKYLDASAEIGLRLGLFGDKDTPMSDFNDEESRSAACFAAWGTFGWHSWHSINFRAKHQIRHPPSLPIPGDAAGPPPAGSMGSTFAWISKFWLIVHEIFKDGYSNFSRQPMHNARRMYQLLLDWADNLPEDAKRIGNCPHYVLILHMWYHAAIIDVWRPYLEARSDKYAAQDSDEYAAHGASVKQLKRLVYLYRTKFESTHQTILITTGLLTLINEVFRQPDASDAQFWFIFAARGCLSIASWCKGLRGITEGLMTMGRRNGAFKREGWADNSLVKDVLSTTRTLLQDGNYSSLYPISLDSVSENIEDIGMEALAEEFQRLNAQNEPRGKEAEVPSEQHIWKGDLRDLSLTLAEATEEEEYI